MLGAYQQHVESQLQEIRGAGLWKPERVLDSPQRPVARLHGGRDVVVLCANNYLGLAADPRVIAAARAALDRWGYGMASVRFICGTQELHKELEHDIADFLGMSRETACRALTELTCDGVIEVKGPPVRVRSE